MAKYTAFSFSKFEVLLNALHHPLNPFVDLLCLNWFHFFFESFLYKVSRKKVKKLSTKSVFFQKQLIKGYTDTQILRKTIDQFTIKMSCKRFYISILYIFFCKYKFSGFF